MERLGSSGPRLRLPATPAEVDAEFIAGVLARNGMPDGVSAESCERIGTDRGISNMVGRVRLTYTGGGAASLIVKLAPEAVTDEADAFGALEAA